MNHRARIVMSEDGGTALLGAGVNVARRGAGAAGAGKLPADRAARKRIAFAAEPTRVIFWDHRKLATTA